MLFGLTPEERERLAWLGGVLIPLKAAFREIIVVSLFVNLLALASPIFVLQVYDRVVYSGGMSTLTGLVIGMALVAVFDYVLRQTRANIVQKVALKIEVEVGQRLFDKVMCLPLRTLESRPTAFWQTLFRDVDLVRNTLSGSSAVLVADLPFTIFALMLIMVIAPPVGAVLVIALPAFMFLAWYSGRSLDSANQTERKAGGSRDTLIAELISGRTTVKALALDRAMRPLWEDRAAGAIEQALTRGGKADGFVNVANGLTLATTVAQTTVGAIFIVSKDMTMGALVAANMLAGRLLGPLNQLVGTWRTYSQFRQSVMRLADLFAEDEENRVSGIAMERPKGKITLDHVIFGYGGKNAPVVDNVKFDIGPGGITALLGKNGSGKTTILKLIHGLYKPTSGRVLLDGADTAQFTREELVRWMGYVPQECVLFTGSIRDNIAYGNPQASDEDILRAARQAGVHQYIIDFPDGYNTQVGEAGSRLSGGQRQRLVIARALVVDPPVLLLDEPTASLDRQAEEEFRATLVELAKSRTVVMVTHSPILLSSCHQIVALDKGKVAISGSAAELLPKLFGYRRSSDSSTPAHLAQSAPRPATAKPAAPAQTTTTAQKTTVQAPVAQAAVTVHASPAVPTTAAPASAPEGSS